MSDLTDENERLRSANKHLRERVGELESLRVEWKATALREAAEKIRRATHDRLERYEGAPKETASLAIDGTIRLLERMADEAEHS